MASSIQVHVCCLDHNNLRHFFSMDLVELLVVDITFGKFFDDALLFFFFFRNGRSYVRMYQRKP